MFSARLAELPGIRHTVKPAPKAELRGDTEGDLQETHWRGEEGSGMEGGKERNGEEGRDGGARRSDGGG